MAIEIKSDAEIAIMREAGAILAQVIDVVMAAVQPGVRESELDELAHAEFRRHNVIPTFLDYPSGGAFPYPAVTCISVNDRSSMRYRGNARYRMVTWFQSTSAARIAGSSPTPPAA